MYQRIYDTTTYGGTKLQIVVTLDSLFRHRLSDALGVSTLELAGEQVAEPALQQRRHAAHEKEPHTPARRPEATARTLAHRTLQTHDVTS